MFTHSECEISQSWRTQFSSHGAFNLSRADMPLLPLSLSGVSVEADSCSMMLDCLYSVDICLFVCVDLIRSYTIQDVDALVSGRLVTWFEWELIIVCFF